MGRGAAGLVIWFATCAVITANQANAQDSPVIVVPRGERPELAAFLEMAAPRDRDGTLAAVTGFVQREPRDGDVATERTVVYLSYDDTALHVTFVCFDRDPGQIRARVLPRGTAVLDDDLVSIQLDTFHDRRRAYTFMANPLGIQNTAMWVEGAGWDHSFDTVWHSAGQLTPNGFVVTMTIPFKSLRFPSEPGRAWGVMLQRRVARSGEDAYWPAYTNRVEGRLQQAGAIRGMQGISPGRLGEIIPYGFSDASLDRAASDGGLVAGRRGGLDAKFVAGGRLVVDATLNPDFSQVESDEPQRTLTERFEVFVPERRPFFIENASYFDTPLALLFTRRLVEPAAGVRVTGKFGAYAVGVLAADDRNQGGDRARVGAVRVSRDLGAQGSVGMFYSDYAAGPIHSRVVAVDGRTKLASTWTVTWQSALSATREPVGSDARGQAHTATVRRDGRHFSYRLLAEARSPRFATPIGFTPRADVLIAEQLVSYRFRPEGRRLLTWGPDILVRRVWDAGGRLLDRSTGPAVHWAWARQTSFGAYYLATAETLTPADAPALAGDTVFPGHRRGVLFSTQAFRAVNVSGQYESGTRANTTPPDGRAPAPAQFAFADLSVTVRPAAAHTVQLTYLLTRLADATTAAPLFDGHVSRLRWNWQITRPLSLRVILHYDGVGADPARTRVEASRTLNADVLVTWFAHPGTALYVGYNTNARYLATLPGRSPGFETDARRFFAKASYRIRF